MTQGFIYAYILSSAFYLGGMIGVPLSAASQHSDVTSLRNVDFLNFTYSTPSDVRCTARDQDLCLQSTIRVKNGLGIEDINEVDFYVEHPASESRQVSYGDLTGDGIEEAVISFKFDLVDGSTYYFAVFGLENRKPRLLQWLSHRDVNNNNNDALWPKDMQIKNGRVLITGVGLNPEDESAPPLYWYDHVWEWNATKKRFQPSFKTRSADNF